ncbi:MAG: hypothetical protein CFE21_15325 [Bacteroidetes bacterium B1(2017)]|nr:MAG: hypothetical protein CFE21_15325 [Bacteroidetes bacterium B1(2017)]
MPKFFGKPLNAVIVDDSPTDQLIIREWLKELPYIKIVLFSKTGHDFLAKYKQLESIDLIIMDYYLPLGNGPEILAQLDPLLQRKSILVSGGYPSKIEQIAETNVGGFCEKKHKVLIKAIKHILSNKRFFDTSYIENYFKENSTKELNDEVLLSNNLSMKEIQIINYLSCGHSYKEAAERIGCLSARSVETYTLHIRKKLKFKNNSQLVKWACVAGILYMFDDVK